MKKFLAVLAAAAIGLSMTAVTFSADEASSEGADSPDSTLCFDSEKSLEYITPVGDVGASGLRFGVSSAEAVNNGSLEIAEHFAEPPSSEVTAGITLNCRDFGLDSFAGCRISAKIFAQDAGADTLSFYSNGDIFISKDVAMTKKPRWESVSLDISENINNTMIGVLISSTASTKGVVCYVDSLRIYTPDGKMIDNVGDFQVIDTSKVRANRVLMVLAFVLLIIVVVGGCSFCVYKYVIKRYR